MSPAQIDWHLRLQHRRRPVGPAHQRYHQHLLGVCTGTHGNEHGYAFVDLPLPVAAGMPAVTVHGQGLVLDTSNRLVAVSNAMSWAH